MRTVWKRIDNWLAVHAPGLQGLLLPGATDEEIHATEAILGVGFPEEIKASYRAHNGVRSSPLGSDFIAGRFQLFSLQEMIEWWERVAGTDAYVIDYSAGDSEDDWRRELRDAEPGDGGMGSLEGYDPKVVPVMSDIMGAILCFDAAHTVHETFGALVTYDPERGMGFSAPSLQAFLSSFADDLETGKYFVEKIETPYIQTVTLRPFSEEV